MIKNDDINLHTYMLSSSGMGEYILYNNHENFANTSTYVGHIKNVHICVYLYCQITIMHTHTCTQAHTHARRHAHMYAHIHQV